VGYASEGSAPAKLWLCGFNPTKYVEEPRTLARGAPLFSRRVALSVPVVFRLVAATAAADLRTPLAKPAIGTIMFLVRRLFKAADQTVRSDFEADTAFVDILFFAIILRSIHVPVLLLIDTLYNIFKQNC
jgi:hypothetical protein